MYPFKIYEFIILTSFISFAISLFVSLFIVRSLSRFVCDYLLSSHAPIPIVVKPTIIMQCSSSL